MLFSQETFDPEIAHDFQGSAYQDVLSQNDLFGIPFWQGDSFWQLMLRFFFNFLICFIIIQFFYYKKSRRRDYHFTFLLFSVTIFLLVYLLENVKMQLGFALGLFAIFGMIRYRTETVPIREMTYLFITIGISVINGLALNVSYAEVLATNMLFIIIIWIFESKRIVKHRASKIIVYEKIEMVKKENEAALLEDLKKRTGLDILKVDVGNIDFLKDIAYLKIYYEPLSAETEDLTHITKVNMKTEK